MFLILVYGRNNSCGLEFKKYSPDQIGKNFGLKKDSFHPSGSKGIKFDILKDLKNDPIYGKQLQKLGKNPDIHLASDGTIRVVSTVNKGNLLIPLGK